MSEAIEEWRAVVGFEGAYEVSSQGRFRSLDRLGADGRALKGREIKVQSHGEYLCVALGDKWPYASHVVLEAFVGPNPGGMVARAINHLKADIRAENLKWGFRPAPARNDNLYKLWMA